jgi:hypothetical protein
MQKEVALQLPIVSSPNGISNEDYHRGEQWSDFLSSTGLKHYLISPKYYKWAKEHPKEIGTEAAIKGSVYHEMLASYVNKGDFSDFENNFFVFEPPINPKTGNAYGYTTKAWEEAYEYQCGQNPGKEVCTTKEVGMANNMIDELLSGEFQKSKDVLHLIKHGEAETSHFLEYEGAKYKYRTDLKTSKKIVDWKTVPLGMAHPDEFPKQIKNFGYHISAAMYQFFERMVTGKWKKFYWIVQEKEPPYDFMIHDSSEWTWNIIKDDDEYVEPKIGAQIFLMLCELHTHCLETQRWPGYEVFVEPDWKKHRIALPEVPGYLRNKMFNYYI